MNHWKAIAVVLALTSCAGPQAKVTLGGKQVPLNVAFGKPRVPASPQEPTVLVPGPSGVGVIEVPADGGKVHPLPSPSVSLPPVRLSCPTPPPGTAAREAAPSSTTGVPKAAVVLVRAQRSTTDARGTITQKELGVLQTSGATTAPSGSTTFDVGLRLFGADSVTNYQTVPPSYNGPVQANTGLISLSSAMGNGGLGYEQSFHPTTPLQVFSQPAYSGAAWTSTSTDPTTQSVAQVTGKVIAEEPVLACGAVIDTWRTETVVHVTNPTQDLVTTVTTWFATQHGGVPVAQTQAYKGTAGTEQVSGTVSWVVDSDAWAG